jgi:S-adenosylmethionine:tRNA ribosyltransferase-isomerase
LTIGSRTSSEPVVLDRLAASAPALTRRLGISMQTDFFDYELPQELIAQDPLAERDQARLLVLRRDTGALAHHRFADLPDLLEPKDLLILNDTRVLPARLRGHRRRTGGKWEGLFLRLAEGGTWEMLSKTRGRLYKEELIDIEGGLGLRPVRQLAPGHWLMAPESGEGFVELLNRFGEVPLPCYIRRGHARAADRERYQTVYARRAGAVAAPTAGLHFTPGVFERLRQRGIDWAFVTLHVGAGTFQPIKVADYRQHQMHAEWGSLPADTAAAINTCKQRGGRVVAVGTTTVRVLETAVAADAQRLAAWSGESSLFIYPPFEFRVVDTLVTNFHLPRSTLLLLVAAFAGSDLLRQGYAAAVQKRYRFYSYGDAMLVL